MKPEYDLSKLDSRKNPYASKPGATKTTVFRMLNIRAFITFVYIILIIVPSQSLFAQENKRPLHVDLSKTLGFIKSQRFNLNRIKDEYPILALQVQKVDLEFKVSFGVAESIIEKKLREILKSRYVEFSEAINKQLDATLISQQMSQEIATQFLIEVESRANGNIPTPILETLLNYQFEQNPVDELKRGYKAKYRTKGHPKAKGLNVDIEHPKSWSLREGNRPNVIQFFSNYSQQEPIFALIIIRNLEQDALGEFTDDEIKALNIIEGSTELAAEFFSDGFLREMAKGIGMINVQSESSKKIVMDRWPGAMLEFIGDKQQLDQTITMYIRNYLVVYKKYMISLQFQAPKMPDDTDISFKNRIDKFSPVFQFMANSLVIQNQY